MIGTILKFAGKLVGPVTGIIGRRQRNKHDYAVARLKDTQHSWKDEFVVVAFVGIFPAAFLGYLFDPIIVWAIGTEWFGPAIEDYIQFMDRILGPEYTQGVILASIGLAGATVAKRGFIDNRRDQHTRSTTRRVKPSNWD